MISLQNELKSFDEGIVFKRVSEKVIEYIIHINNLKKLVT